ncbi:MAG: cytochrome c3 family protein [Deltaproteobacteria bacterium]|nr:cytochrome c3 family protein [Deltaproteobacteria bacterium]
MARRLALLLLGAVLGAVFSVRAQVPAGVAPRPPSRAIYPTQTIPLRFDHSRHLRLGGMTCQRCHTNAHTSDNVGDRLTPTEGTCLPCHAIDRGEPLRQRAPTARCDGCHEGWDPSRPLRVERVQVPAANLRFSHRAHASRGVPCERCHAVRGVGLATRLELPRMESCLGCHRPGGAPDACATCHLQRADGTLETRFAEGWLNPPAWMPGLHHDADFWVDHRASAARDASRCAVCHREDECTDCHDGRVRDRRTHPNDYVTLHVPDARLQGDRCGSCHRVASFCQQCHQRLGVSEGASTSARIFGRVHPPAREWVDPPVTARHHGAEARRSLTTCVSCHAEGDCVRCHATLERAGGGFSPHPPGFAARCGALLRASARPCLACHEDAEALARRCR